MSDKIRWGIVGPGQIAHTFVEDLKAVEDAAVVAVASRSGDRADGFADRYDIPRRYGSYQALFEDSEIDIVYIATPHTSHARLSIDALEHGRAVLCEKPVAMSRQQAEDMVAASRASGRFFMEGFWSRFIPAVREVIDRARSGDVGEVRYLSADFSFWVDADPESRLLNVDLGGGALLDVGVYPLFFAYSILGIPREVSARAKFHATGADIQTAMLLEFEQAFADLYVGFASGTNITATVSGTTGRLVLDPQWFRGDSYTAYWNDGSRPDSIERPREGTGFTHEIRECHECLRSGAIESRIWSHQDSLNLMSIVDRVKDTIGLEYPADAE